MKVEQFQREHILITFFSGEASDMKMMICTFFKWNCLFEHMIVPQNKYNDQRQGHKEFKVMDIKKNKNSSFILKCTPTNAFQTAFGNFQVR